MRRHAQVDGVPFSRGWPAGFATAIGIRTTVPGSVGEGPHNGGFEIVAMSDLSQLFMIVPARRRSQEALPDVIVCPAGIARIKSMWQARSARSTISTESRHGFTISGSDVTGQCRLHARFSFLIRGITMRNSRSMIEGYVLAVSGCWSTIALYIGSCFPQSFNRPLIRLCERATTRLGG